MSEISRSALFGKLNTVAYKAIEGGTVVCKLRGNPYVELVHWIQQILQDRDTDLHYIVRHFEIDTSAVARDITEALDHLPRGALTISDFSPHVESAVERGWVYSTLMFGFPAIRTGTLLVGIVKTPSLKTALHGISRQFGRIDADVLTENFRSITLSSPENDLGPYDGTRVMGPSRQPERHIFICYRRQDSGWATGRIFDRLAAEFGKERVFKDVVSIPIGVKNWEDEVQQNLQTAKVMVAIVGESWLAARDAATGRRRVDSKDDQMRMELKWALDSEGVAVLPVLLDNAVMPDAKGLPPALRGFAKCQAMHVRGDPEFEGDMQHLLLEVRKRLPSGHPSRS